MSIHEALPQTTFTIIQILGVGDPSEILSLGNNDDRNITAGSEFGHWIVIGGIFGFIFFVKLILILFKDISLRKKEEFFCIIYVIITITFFESIYTRTSYSVIFAIIYYLGYDKS